MADRTAPNVGSAVAAEPTANRQLLSDTDVGGEIEDEQTAKEKLEKVGFSVDNLSEETALEDDAGEWDVTPMNYFCEQGDLKMCRYLHANGASTTCRSMSGLWFPMLAAANEGHLDICKWLYECGAAEDIRELNGDGESPLYLAMSEYCEDTKRLSRWLILKGALSRKDSENVDDVIMRRDLTPRNWDADERWETWETDERSQLLVWAQEAVQTDSCLRTFLSGTLFPPDFSASLLHAIVAERMQSARSAHILLDDASGEKQQQLWKEVVLSRYQSTLRCFSGKSGVLEHIAGYVGVVRGRELRILRNLADLLPPFMRDVPHVGPEEID